MERKTVLGRLWERQQQPDPDGDTFVRGESPDAPEPPPNDSQRGFRSEIEAAARARKLHYEQNATDASGESVAASQQGSEHAGPWGDDGAVHTRTRGESVRGGYETRVRGESAG